MAKTLKLSNPEQYTGHSFIRSPASPLASFGVDILTLKCPGDENPQQLLRDI